VEFRSLTFTDSYTESQDPDIGRMKKGERQMEHKIVSREAFKVVGMKYRGKNENQEIPQLWRDYGARWKEIEDVVNPEVAYGVMDNYDESTGEFDYVAAMEVARVKATPEGMMSWGIPEQTYAVFPCTLATIRESYDAALKKWLPDSKYKHSGGTEFELYDEDFDPQDPDSLFYYYMPIKEK
jgi:AraC family transcriptional regulator